MGVNAEPGPPSGPTLLDCAELDRLGVPTAKAEPPADAPRTAEADDGVFEPLVEREDPDEPKNEFEVTSTDEARDAATGGGLIGLLLDDALDALTTGVPLADAPGNTD